MNRNDFLNMIGSKDRVNRSMLGEVYELVDLFPYFQSAHMLLLKGLSDNDDVKFDKQLRNSAIHIADREVLYYLLKNDPSAISDTAGLKPEAEPVSEQIDESAPDTRQTVIESAKNSELLISEIEMNGNNASDKDIVDREVLSTGHSVLMSSDLDLNEPEGVVLIIDENGQTEEEKVFYMDPGFAIPEESDLLELDTEDADPEKLRSEKESEEGIKWEDDKSYKKQLQSELIDKFIVANPRIEPVRDKTVQPVEDLSKPHIEEKEGFVTETLARIYLNQGYYSRAIEIYEKLSLKFPEKSSYFATQIKKVKEYIKK